MEGRNISDIDPGSESGLLAKAAAKLATNIAIDESAKVLKVRFENAADGRLNLVTDADHVAPQPMEKGCIGLRILDLTTA